MRLEALKSAVRVFTDVKAARSAPPNCRKSYNIARARWGENGET